MMKKKKYVPGHGHDDAVGEDGDGIVSFGANPPIDPFFEQLWFNYVETPGVDKFAMQLREHKWWTAYSPDITYSKPTATSLKCYASNANIGEGFAFVTLPKALIHNKKVKLTWSTWDDHPSHAFTFYARIVDGAYLRNDAADWPTNDASSYLSKGAGYLQTIENLTGINASHTVTITANLAASTLDNVTIMIIVYEGSSYQGYFTIESLRITSLADVLLYEADLAGALIMEKTGSDSDYGIIGTGEIGESGSYQSMLHYWNVELQTWVPFAEPYYQGGMLDEYLRGDKTFQTLLAAAVKNIPAGSITETNVQAALNGLDTNKLSIVGLREKAINLLATVNVSFAGTGQTTLYTAPAGKRFVSFALGIEAGSDAGATVITAGQVGALTDFLPANTLSNLDAQYDFVWLQPIPNITPLKLKSYAAGTVFQMDVTTAEGGAINKVFVFGYLY